ncbi:hypothetical protein E2C01_009111 [Portunus trituberculatus]|uniref:Uncharacterized protein n=1 Tax=Portunus trituberculatus TaxID=210409 RepID=A0A5B7D3T0_PORTR|nr:hypothetical protein [Portunus trituberculatus]
MSIRHYSASQHKTCTGQHTSLNYALVRQRYEGCSCGGGGGDGRRLLDHRRRVYGNVWMTERGKSY